MGRRGPNILIELELLWRTLPIQWEEGALVVGEGQESLGCKAFQTNRAQDTFEGETLVLGRLYLMLFMQLCVSRSSTNI